MKKTLLIIVIALVAFVGLVLGVRNYNRQGITVINPPGPPSKPIGSLTGPDISSRYLTVGGVRHEYRRVPLNTATTTPCALDTPAATSTLLHFSLRLTTASSTASVWTAAKASTPYATTTAFDQFSVGSGAVATMFVGAASSTVPDEVSVIAPSQYVVWGVQGSVISDAANWNGFCQAEFIVIP